MRSDGAEGRVQLALFEESDQLLVLRDDVVEVERGPARGGHGEALLSVAQRLEEAGQKAVLGRRNDREVEVGLGDGEGGEVAAAGVLGLLGDQIPELVDERAWGPVVLGEQLGDRERLDELACFRQRGGLVGGDGHHDRAALGVELQESFCLQAREGLAHGGAAHPERGRHLALRDDVAAGQSAVDDAGSGLLIGTIGRRQLSVHSAPLVRAADGANSCGRRFSGRARPAVQL